MLKKIKDSKFTSLTNDIANNRALSVIPELKQLKAFNKGTSISQDIVDLIQKEGLFRYFQPKKWGGMELDFQAWLDIPEII